MLIKCKIITFTQRNFTVQPSYLVNGMTLQVVESVTDLGIKFDRYLNFSDHIDKD